MGKIFKVTTEGDAEGRSVRTLGYATGNYKDIEAYFEDKKFYSLIVEEITVLNISPTDVTERKNLSSRKLQLEKELSQINEKLKN